MDRILMLGGARSQIPVIKRAKELGLYVITCDNVPNNPGHAFSDEYYNVSTVEMEEVLRIAEKSKIDGIIAYASDPAAMTCAYVSDRLGLPGSSLESVQLLSRKDIFRKFQKERGFNTPRFIVAEKWEELKEIEEKVGFPCMLKPVDSSGSKGVRKINNYKELETSFPNAAAYSRCGKVIAEEYIPTPYHQLHGDGVVADGKLKFIALGDQRFFNSVPIGSSLPSSINSKLMEKAEVETKRLIEQSGFLCGGINIEVRVTAEGEIYIIEIGARSGGNYIPQLMQLSTGEDVMSAVLNISMGMPYKIGKPKRTGYYFQYIIGGRGSGRFRELYVDPYIRDKIVELYVHKQQGDWIETYQNSGGVVGVAMIRFSGMEEMETVIENIGTYIQVIVD